MLAAKTAFGQGMRTIVQQLRPHTALQGKIGRPCRTQRLRVMIANGDRSSGPRERQRPYPKGGYAETL